MLRFLRRERLRAMIVAIPVFVCVSLGELLRDGASFGEAAVLFAAGIAVAAAFIGLVAWRNPTLSRKRQAPEVTYRLWATDALPPGELIRYITRPCTYNTLPAIVCITDLRLAVIRPGARIFRTKPSKIADSAELISVRSVGIGRDVMNFVTVATVQVELEHPQRLSAIGFVERRDAENLTAALSEWAQLVPVTGPEEGSGAGV